MPRIDYLSKKATMNKAYCYRLSALGFALALLLSCQVSQAALILTPHVEIVANGGQLQYTYSIEVDALSDFAATDFSLDVATGADIHSIVSPIAWSVSYAAGDPFIYWYAPFDGSGDILPGSAATFSLRSSFAPGPQAYSSFGLSLDTSDFDIASGTINAPSVSPANNSAVPEPGTIIAWCGLCVFGLISRAARRKNKFGVSSPPRAE